MRSALAMSLNIPAVKTLYLAGIENTINLAHSMGISTLNEKNRYGLALVLGGGEVTLLDETSGFSVFANDGKRNPLTGVLKIIDSQGKDFYDAQLDEKQVLDPQVARKIISILSDNNARAPVFGSANKLVISGHTVAAKTGTTQEFHDAWTVGYTPSLATGVWAGNNDNQAMTAGADGSYVAAPIWNSFMSQVLRNYPQESFTDYDRTKIKNMVNSTEMPKIIYINNKSGKELSDKKLKKTDPDKISMKIEYPDSFNSNSTFLSPETQKTDDPMILRWQESLNKPMDFLDQSKKDNKN
jgi:membrane peptidoglycan carboxypeptidase